jgi:L,D-peptidoglycan transpeptidase YkuD (ErfK/YbiS/YcfS/YnhG family)
MLKDTNFIVTLDKRLTFLNYNFPCSWGSNGLSHSKIEGDGTTPIGTFPFRKVFFRKDRMDFPKTDLETIPINKDDGWCDDQSHQDYNQFVKLPHIARCETLWRKDHLYDLLIVLGYNDQPPIGGKGSAIFMHVARKHYKPTRGCIALSISDLLIVVAHANQNSFITIGS